ncbi:unnamed protein product, partial [Hymenolepis diminuta]
CAKYFYEDAEYCYYYRGFCAPDHHFVRTGDIARIIKSYTVGFQFPGKMVFDIRAIAKNFERFGQIRRIVQNPWIGKGFVVFTEQKSAVCAHLELYHSVGDRPMELFQLRDSDIENDLFSVELFTDSKLGDLMRSYKMYRVDFRVTGSIPAFTSICECFCQGNVAYQLEFTEILMRGSAKFWSFAFAETIKSNNFVIGDAFLQCEGEIYTEIGHMMVHIVRSPKLNVILEELVAQLLEKLLEPGKEVSEEKDNVVSEESNAATKSIETIRRPSSRKRPSGYRLVRITPVLIWKPETKLTLEMNFADDSEVDVGSGETKSLSSPSSSDSSASKNDTISSVMEFLNSLPSESSVKLDESVSSHETEGSLFDGSENFDISDDTHQQKIKSQTTQSSEETSSISPRSGRHKHVTFSSEVTYCTIPPAEEDPSNLGPEKEGVCQSTETQARSALEDSESGSQHLSPDVSNVSQPTEPQTSSSRSKSFSSER